MSNASKREGRERERERERSTLVTETHVDESFVKVRVDSKL